MTVNAIHIIFTFMIDVKFLLQVEDGWEGRVRTYE